MAFCQHRMHWLCCKTKRSQWPAYGARALCSVFSLRGLEQRVDRDRSSGRAVWFASSNLKQLTCIQAFYLVSILTQSTCKKWGIWYIYIYICNIYIYICLTCCLTCSSTQRWKESEKRREKKRKEEKKKEDQKRESLRRKKVQVREKVGKSQNAVFFQWFVAPEGRKAGSLKRRVRGHVVRWDEKLHAVAAQSTFPIQNVQSTSASELFWSWDVEKVHSVVARSTFPSPNVQNTAASEPVGSWDVQKVYTVVARSNMSKSKVQKIEGYGALLDVQMSFRVAGARDCAPCQKWAKHEGCVAVSKTMAGVGHVQRIR